MLRWFRPRRRRNSVVAPDIEKSLHSEAWRRVSHSSRSWIVGIAAAAVTYLLLGWAARPWVVLPSFVLQIVCFIAAVGVTGVVYRSRQQIEFHQLQREYAEDVCVQCGYMMAMLSPDTTNRCPECGTLRIAMPSDVRMIPARSDDARAIMAELDDHLRTRYPGTAIHGLSPDEDEATGVRFFILRAPTPRHSGGSDERQHIPDAIAACGALRLLGDNVGEVTRVYVRGPFRGRDVARKLLAVVERRAQLERVIHLRTATTSDQTEAIELYRSCGYDDIPRYGQYTDDHQCVCLQKTLPLMKPSTQ